MLQNFWCVLVSPIFAIVVLPDTEHVAKSSRASPDALNGHDLPAWFQLHQVTGFKRNVHRQRRLAP